jgi:protein-S-isoprenylcysteine O-methyltransferase Ste14
LGDTVIFSILVLSLFFGLYAALHSLLASLPVKQRAKRILGPTTDRWYRLAYNIFAVVTLLPLFPLLVLLPDKTLYIILAPWRWLMIAGQLLALAGLGVAFLQTEPFHFLGLAQLFAKQPAEINSFSVHGFYNRVRHPLYFFSLLFLWLTPVMSVNLLVTYLLITVYFYIGSVYEEKRLLAKFGATYQDYQRRVPRLLPLPHRRYQ